jgi:hypothetical protein
MAKKIAADTAVEAISETISETTSATPAAPVAQSTAASGAAKIVWDDSGMHTSYANVCNILGTREEITLLFGSNQTWLIGQDQMRVKLTDRIVINPFMAKRLLDMLTKGISEYESRFGSLSS